MIKHILFVCTGNTCRSPMAEGLFRTMARAAGHDLELRSAGVSAMEGSPISSLAVKTLQERGITEASEMTSQVISEELVSWADLILTMTVQHKAEVIRRYPQAVETTFTLKEFVNIETRNADKLELADKLHAELQLKHAMGQTITALEQDELFQLEQELAGVDISDPYGGSEELYKQCADELEQQLRRLLEKINHTHD